MRWLGHVHRRDESNIIKKKITMCKLFNSKRRGRPREIWIDNVEKDFDKMNIRNWKGLALRRGKWMAVVLEAEACMEVMAIKKKKK